MTEARRNLVACLQTTHPELLRMVLSITQAEEITEAIEEFVREVIASEKEASP